MDHTPVDSAYLAHAADPDNERLHHRFLERVMDAELFTLVENEPAAGRINPRIMDLAESRFVLVFDRDARLAEFLDTPAPYVAVAGRRLVEMLAGQGLGLGLNLGVAPSSTLLPAGVVEWLAENMVPAPGMESGRPDSILPPANIDPDLLAALDIKLASLAHLIREAHLVEAEFSGEDTRLMLALAGVPEQAQADVASAMAEAVRFSGMTDRGLDVTFLEATDPALARISGVSIRFELPRAARSEAVRAVAPGMDPDRPPVLR